MEFLTKIPLQSQPYNQIDYNSKTLLLGSCFVENIGEKLEYFKFQNSINPFGIMFHPKVIETLISNAINEKIFSDLQKKQTEIEIKMADSNIYLAENKAELTELINKQAAIKKNLILAEEKWLEAMEKLERSELNTKTT